MPAPNRTELREFVVKRFSRSELVVLCSDYFPDFYRDHEGRDATMSSLAEALVAHCERRDQLERLRYAVHAARAQPYEASFGAFIAEEIRVKPRSPSQIFEPPPTSPPPPPATSNPNVRRINDNHLAIVMGNGIEMEMLRIPAGEFLMGSDKTKDPDAYDDELPQHRVNLGEYWLGKTQVTVEQFALFVKTTGYAADANTARAGKEKHPVSYVSWNDAAAFCKWLAGVSKLKVRLPSEAEWEKGARGTHGRIYPWGNQAISSSRANYASIFRLFKAMVSDADTTPVGTYSPAGDSPYELQDMSGNVWEWTSSLYQRYPYNESDGRESERSSDDRVVRGGRFNYYERSVRCAYRRGGQPDFRLNFLGFRCLLSPPL